MQMPLKVVNNPEVFLVSMISVYPSICTTLNDVAMHITLLVCGGIKFNKGEGDYQQKLLSDIA